MNTPVSPHKPVDTRAAILRTARELLLTRSYLGLSFQELADRVGIRKASLYHHFDSKEALGIAVFTDAGERFLRWAGGLMGRPPAEQVLAYIHMVREVIGASRRVCPIGATGGEWECLEPALQAAVRHFHQLQLDWLAEVMLKVNGGQPTAEALLSARQWAAQINAVCQGALISARLHDDAGMYDLAVAPLMERLGGQH